MKEEKAYFGAPKLQRDLGFDAGGMYGSNQYTGGIGHSDFGRYTSRVRAETHLCEFL